MPPSASPCGIGFVAPACNTCAFGFTASSTGGCEVRDSTLAQGYAVAITLALTADVAAAPSSFSTQFGLDVASAAGSAVSLSRVTLSYGSGGRRLQAMAPTSATVVLTRASKTSPAAADATVNNAIASILVQMSTPFSELRQGTAGRYIDASVQPKVAVVANPDVNNAAPGGSSGAASTPGAIIGFVVLAFAVLAIGAAVAIVVVKRSGRRQARRHGASRSGILSSSAAAATAKQVGGGEADGRDSHFPTSVQRARASKDSDFNEEPMNPLVLAGVTGAMSPRTPSSRALRV